MKKERLITKFITISFIGKKEKLMTIDIPFENVYVLELEDITTTIGHTSDGEVLDFLNCKRLNLRLYKDKLDEKTIDVIKKNSIISVGLNFENGGSKTYNVAWYTDDKIVNLLQRVEDKDNIIKITVDE